MDGAGADLDDIGTARQHRLVAHPQDRASRTGRPPRPDRWPSQITSPRLTSISSSRVMVIDWPATARSRSPSTRDDALRRVRLRPEGSTLIAIAGLRTAPAAMVPEKPRKVWSGRFTHCTGMRNGPCRRIVSRPARFRDGRAGSGRRYQGMACAGSTTLSPCKRRDRNAGDVAEAECSRRTRDSRPRSLETPPGRSSTGPSC